MKRILSLLLILAVALPSAALSGCTDNPGSSSAQSTPSEAKKHTDSTVFDSNEPMGGLHPIDYKGDSFAGAWRITKGVGSNLKHFLFIFDGNETSYLAVGTTAFIGKYQAGKFKLDDGSTGERFKTQLMFGLDGIYQYKFSNDGKTVVLTNDDGGDTTTMEAVDSFSVIPGPMEDFKIDKNLVGAWEDEDGGFRYFGENGLCYSTQKNVNFYYYAYSAESGKCKVSYTMLIQTDETCEYKVDGDKLTFNGEKFTRV